MTEHRDAAAQEEHLRQRAERECPAGPDASLFRANHMLGGWKASYHNLYEDYQEALRRIAALEADATGEDPDDS